MGKESVRVTMRLSGAELAQIREVQDLLSVNAEVDACRYLMQRGLEALSSQLGAKKLFKRLEGLANPQEMLPLLAMMQGDAGSNIRPAEKVS